jgi:arginase
MAKAIEFPAQAANASGIYSGVQALPPRKIKVIGVPLDLGAARRGVDMGPSAVRVAGLEARLEALGHEVRDGGNISVAVAETKSVGEASARYLKEITETCSRAAEMVEKALSEGMTPVILGGDHSVAAGSVSGVADYYRKQNQKIGLIWIDAHADMNTPATSPSGNVHGMPLAALLGLGPEALTNLLGFAPKVQPENVVLIGVRDIDATEKENIKRAGVTEVYTMRDIDERGICARRDAGPRGITFRWTWTGSIRRMRRGWGHRCAAGRPIARHIWRWRSSRITGGWLRWRWSR